MNPALQKFQGPWNITMLEVDGALMPAADAQIIVQNDNFTTLGMGAVYTGKITIDSSDHPWKIDMEFTDGPEKGNINRGIFEFNGDVCRLCLQTTGGARPENFATQAGSGLALETLVRATLGTGPQQVQNDNREKIPQIVPFNLSGAPVLELDGEWAMVSCAQNGKNLDAVYVKMGRRVATADETTIFMGKQTIMKARYTVDTSQQPNTIDYLLPTGERQLGIFRRDGDILEISFAAPGKTRPTSFNTASGDERTVTAWKRLKG